MWASIDWLDCHERQRNNNSFSIAEMDSTAAVQQPHWYIWPQSVYWININTNVDNTVKQCVTCMVYQQTLPHEKIIPSQMPYKHCEVIGADIFTNKSNALLFIVNYYSKFPVIKKTDGLYDDSLIREVKIVFAEFGLPKKKNKMKTQI